MAQSKGIKVQPSRFAALNLDSDSESDASGNEWFEVATSSKSTGKTKGRGAAAKNGSAGDRPLSKSAKKRARKKRNQPSSSEVN